MKYIQLKQCKMYTQLCQKCDAEDLYFSCEDCPFDECYDHETRMYNTQELHYIKTARSEAKDLLASESPTDDEVLRDVMWKLMRCAEKKTAKELLVKALKDNGYEKTAKLLDDNMSVHYWF